MSSSKNTPQKKNTIGKIFFYFISIIVAIILIIVLIATLMTRSSNDAITLFGYSLFPISTQGGYAQDGDLVVCKMLENDIDIAVNDDVVYHNGYDSYKNVIIQTARIGAMETTDGESYFSSANFDGKIPVSNIVGTISFSIPKFGAFILLLKTPMGLVCCVALPLFLLLVFEVINLIKLSRVQKREDKDEETKLPSYMRLNAIEALEETEADKTAKLLNKNEKHKPYDIGKDAVDCNTISSFNKNVMFEPQDEILEFVEPKRPFQSITYTKPDILKTDAHTNSIYSTKEWQLPIEIDNEKPQVSNSEKNTDFQASISTDTKNHFNIEGIDVAVVSDALNLSLDENSKGRDISITVTNDYTNVIVSSGDYEVNFALFKDDSDKEQKVVIQKKIKK